jgi:hypothetical protein
MTEPALALAFATFLMAFDGTVVPLFVVGMGRTEPPVTSLTVVAGFFVAGLVERGNSLAGPFEGLRFHLSGLLRHRPSSWGDSTP